MDAGGVRTFRVDLVVSESGELQAPCQMPVHLHGVLEESLWKFFAEKLNKGLTTEHEHFQTSNQNCRSQVQCNVASVCCSIVLFLFAMFSVRFLGWFIYIIMAIAVLLFACTVPIICYSPVWFVQDRRLSRRNARIAFEGVREQCRRKCPGVELKVQDHVIVVTRASRSPDPEISGAAGRLQVEFASEYDSYRDEEQLRVPSHPPILLQGVLDQTLWTSFSTEVNAALEAEERDFRYNVCFNKYLAPLKFGFGMLFGLCVFGLCALFMGYGLVSFVFFGIGMGWLAGGLLLTSLAYPFHVCSRRSARNRATVNFERICQEHRDRYPEVELQVLLVGSSCGPSRHTHAVTVEMLGPAATSQALPFAGPVKEKEEEVEGRHELSFAHASVDANMPSLPGEVVRCRSWS